MTEVVVALDVDVERARMLVDSIPEARWYKVGLELIHTPEGYALSQEILSKGKFLFLDSKLSDTPNTTSRTVYTIVQRWRPHLLTVRHNAEKAVEAAAGSNTNILYVPSLTTDADSRVEKTIADGVVCRPSDAVEYRKRQKDLIIVVPGLRIDGMFHEHVEQESKCPQADLAVVGRSIVCNADPRRAFSRYAERLA